MAPAAAAAAAALAPDAMQQFPEGAHVRLRSRVHGGYLHAGEDGVGVSLSWGRRSSMNAAWQVHRMTIDGTTYVLLHSAAYGRYLAASPHPAPPGHRGHSVVQGDYGEQGVNPILWKPVGSGHAGYVLLRHVSYRFLPANGRYRLWLSGAPVDDFDNQSTMMDWKVEAIPPRPAPPVLPPPTPIKRGGCCSLFLLHQEPGVLEKTIRLGCVACQRACNGSICRRCVAQVKKNLELMKKAGRDGFFGYCLKCHEVAKGSHLAHQDNIIPVDRYKGHLVAWVTGKENWAAIFHGIQSDMCYRPPIGRPFLLHTPEECCRCIECNDVMYTKRLYDMLSLYCTINCWLEERSGGGAAEVQVAEALLAMEFDSSTHAVCLTCSMAFSSSEASGHAEHDMLSIVMESGRLPRLQIPSAHYLAHVWRNIKGWDPDGMGDILIKDNSSPRCQTCQMRLVDGGSKTCSFECCLPQPSLLPRPLQRQQLAG
ncbi:hypothetical protein SEVIR_4G061700v4 [Setaria viridis]|uniref:DUF569 domain-containing protein n=1 Tax=Setaria viridis TaxID=4556 RepID=A0A4U6UW98_SETVI|nr:uncharacterized protein LOC117854260 [Setaria viridis]TKW20082.1 hypothetical protein SEVIR_4G061700v2 [Setaria viridis]